MKKIPVPWTITESEGLFIIKASNDYEICTVKDKALAEFIIDKIHRFQKAQRWAEEELPKLIGV